MSTIETLVLGLTGHALAWETVVAVVAVLAVGLVAVVAARTRPGRRRPAAGAGPDRELESLRRIATELARTSDVEGVVRALLDEIGQLFDVGFVGLVFISDDGSEASGFIARARGADVRWWSDVRVDLEREPSGIASAVFEATPFAVYDVVSSQRVSTRLVAEVGAKSAAFVPLIGDGRVTAVIAVATTDAHRAFSADDLGVMQTLASEAGTALERTRTGIALEEALRREQLVTSIGRRLRSALDLETALRATVEETARALEASRCFVRLGPPGGPLSIVAQWHGPGEEAAGGGTELPVSNLAAREQRTVSFADVEQAPELTDPELGGLEYLRSLGSRGAAATPIVVQGRPLGVLGVHRSVPRAWTQRDIVLLEAVAAEAGLAIQLGRLLEESRERLTQQTALLRAAQVLSGELDLAVVLQRLVDEVAGFLDAEAADCYLFDRERGVLRCAAVHGFDPDLLGFEFVGGQGLAGLAVREGKPLVAGDYAELAARVPHPAYHDFTDVIVAPMRWSDEVQGVLGVGRRDGRPFEEREVDALEAFAGLASLALRNAATFTQSARQAQVQRGFYRIASALGQSLSRSATLDAVAEAAADALGGASSAVLMPQGGRLALAGGYELPARFRALLEQGIAAGDGPLARAAAQSRVIASPSLADDDRLPDGWRAAAEEYRALLSVPVETPRHEAGGFVAVFFAEERVFTDDDLELARHLADAARGALERSELFEAERSARARAQQLTRTGRL
ncbi:MAG: GAF domain-containing protein, partial [Gaiellaceae bacterium]